MALDPSIALGVKPLQIPQTNALAQFGQVLDIKNAMQQQEARNALNAAYTAATNLTTGEIDQNKLYQSLATGPAAYQIPTAQKTIREAKAAQLKLDADAFKFNNDKIDRFAQHVSQFNSAPEAIADIQGAMQANRIDANTGNTYLTQLQNATTPEAFAAWKNNTLRSALDAKAQLEQHFFTQDTGAGGQQMAVPKYGGGAAQVVPGSQFTKVMSPYESARIAQMNQRLQAESAVGALSPDTLDFAAQMYTQSGTLPPLGIGKGAAQIKAQIMNRAAQIAMGGGEGRAPVSAADAAGNVIGSKQTVAAQGTALKSFNTGVEGRAVRSFNTAVDHLDTMSKLADALQNNDVRAFNTIGNAFAAATGSAAPTNFDSAKAIVGGEVAKALTGSNMALKDREEIRDTLARANSPEQLKGVITTMQQLMGGQLKSLETQYTSSTGRKDFSSKLSKRSKEVVQSLGGEGGAPAVPAAAPSNIPQAAIDALKSGKGTDAQFDEIFGAGAAKRVRGR